MKSVLSGKPYCVQCKEERPASNFFESKNRLNFPDGKVNVCKKCISDFVANGDLQSVLYVLMSLDKPFIYDRWDGAKESNPDNPLGAYLRSLSMKNFKDKSYMDSVFYPVSSVNNSFSNSEDDDYFSGEIVLTNSTRRRWLGHKDDDDILFLEHYFQDITSKHGCDTYTQEQIYKNMATTQLEANKALLSGNIGNYEKLIKTMSSLMGDAKIKPVQDTGEDANGLATWGQWVKKIEETEPIPEPREEFKDVDNIWKYIKTWFVDHFARVFDLKQEDAIEESGDSHA